MFNKTIPFLNPLGFIETYKKIIKSKDYIVLSWFDDIPNWGDQLSPIIVNQLSNKNIVNYNNLLYNDKPVYFAIGSILNSMAIKKSTIWGSGFISTRGKVNKKPGCIFAVRGPKTRDLLTRNGISCPDIYGDPAIIYKNYYRPIIKKKYDFGIILHYNDRKYFSNMNIKNKDMYSINFIDVRSSIKSIIDQVSSCNKIISSSLHGIIAADMYDVPSYWFKFKNNLRNDDFKFYDYYASHNVYNIKPNIYEKSLEIEEIIDECSARNIDKQKAELLANCPFLP
jgi:pyruvyltransferase